MLFIFATHLILWVTSCWISPILWNIDPRYMKHPLEAISFTSSFIIPPVIFFVLMLILNVLLWLNLKPCVSNSCLYRFNLAFITLSMVSSTNTMSSKNMHQGTSYLGPLRKERGLSRVMYLIACSFQVDKNHMQIYF